MRDNTRTLPIAYGASCHAKKWSNKMISYGELCGRLQSTIRTPETVEEYQKMKKAERDSAKDKGGYVGGILRGGRRKRDAVESRSMLTADLDHAEKDFLDKYRATHKYASCLYTTHGHTPEEPRYRVIFPLTRDVTTEEYQAIMRFVAAELGIDQFDECSYRPHQLMYWPSTPSNGQFIFEKFEGAWLDPDAVLTAHPNWRDCAQLPTSSRESAVRQQAVAQQEDPLTKKGLVGAFCRTYSIRDAIATFLADVYEPSASEGRYDYIPADSSAGVVLYDDRFAYSHHASDPACGQLLNAFDLVRVHKFGNLDPGEDTKRSNKAMLDFAAKDDEVKLTLIKEKAESAAEDFAAAEKEEKDDKRWRKKLTVDGRGHVEETLDNLVLILRNDYNLHAIAFNRHRDGIDAVEGLPWTQMKPGWSDTDYAALKVYLSGHYGIYAPSKTKDAVMAVASERSYHPIQDYLEGLPEWDGVERVDHLLIDYFGADDNAYTRAVIRKALVAAVARIYEPGKKFDSVLILNGPQGIGKSTFFSKLAGPWFSDSLTLTDMKDKSGPEKLQGYWILELGELAGMRKADVETVKSFISREDDKYRASYGLNVENHPRQCIIVGSTNAETGFLRDITGNRRFWPVRVSGSSAKKTWQLTETEVGQIWAETLFLYGLGENLFLEGEESELAGYQQADAMEMDEREGLVRTYLDTLLPEKWPEMTLYERRAYLAGDDFNSQKEGQTQRTTVCNMEIWCECFGRDAASMKAADSYAIAGIMRRIEGWRKGNDTKSGAAMFPIYGKQRVYSRITRPGDPENDNWLINSPLLSSLAEL